MVIKMIIELFTERSRGMVYKKSLKLLKVHSAKCIK